MTSQRSIAPTVTGLAVLVGIGVVAVVNSVGTEALPFWRQVLFVVLAPAAYLHGRHSAAPHGGWVLAGLALVASPLVFYDRDTAATVALVLAVFVVSPWLAGRNRRRQAQLARAAVERVAHLEREQELVAQRAQALERARIAADLHDHLGHDLALIAVQAGALEVSAGLGPTERAAAAQIRAGAMTATDRLRATLGALRDESVAPVPTEPAEDPISAIVARATAAGLDVRFEGDPEGASGMAGGLVGDAAHRVVQESLTNAARHAPGAAVTVQVQYRAGAVLVAVTSAEGAAPLRAGRTTTSSRPASALVAGTGLAALAERVRILDGTFSAGPEADGFVVRARIPSGALGVTQ